jgi:hypothetical protein
MGGGGGALGELETSSNHKEFSAAVGHLASVEATAMSPLSMDCCQLTAPLPHSILSAVTPPPRAPALAIKSAVHRPFTASENGSDADAPAKDMEELMLVMDADVTAKISASMRLRLGLLTWFCSNLRARCHSEVLRRLAPPISTLLRASTFSCICSSQFFCFCLATHSKT